MTVTRPSNCIRGFLRRVPRLGLFLWLSLHCLLVTAQVAPSVAVKPPFEPSPGALTNVLAQIEGLQLETAALSPAQKKIYPSLLNALREHRGTAPRPYAPLLRSGVSLLPGGRILVDINATVTATVLANIQKLGGTIVNSFAQYQAIRAEIPIESLEGIAGLTEVNAIRPGAVAVSNIGSATSEGDVGHQANFVRSTYNASGAGVKVGVISTSDLGLKQSQSTLDLGFVTELPGQSGLGLPGGDPGEGTAMMEIVHDLATNAQLFFATGLLGDINTAASICSMATNYGCQIIIDDITSVYESPFHENQPLSQAIQTVSDLGVLCFSAAGNDGDQDSGTSGTWQGDFNPGQGTTFPTIPGTLHDWGQGSVFNLVTNKNVGSEGVLLFWTDPWGGASSDYNVYVTDGSGNLILAGNGVQAGAPTDWPMEWITAGATNGQFIVVARMSGPTRMIQVSTVRGGLAISTAGATRGHNAPSAANAFGVAGVAAQGVTTAFSATNLLFYKGSSNATNDLFYNLSSDGPRRIFYETDGTAVTPNDFTSTGGRVLQKPDMTAATGVTASLTFTTNSGFRPFYGTSASAPHAGAIAALLLSYRPDLTPDQVSAALTNTTVSFGAGLARDQGAGVVMADQAMAYLIPTVHFAYPTNGQVLSDLTAPQIAGYADNNTASLSAVRVALSRNTDGAWYDFVNGGWGTTTFNFNNNVLLASDVSGEHTGWLAQLPLLPDGNYTVQTESVDVANHASPWLSETFTVAPLLVTFSPLTNTETVFDFSQIGGTINAAVSAAFRIEQYDASGADDLYWDGISGWLSNGDDPAVWLPATITGNTWAPAASVILPTREQTRYGPYFLRVVATDTAGDTSTNEILVTRSAPDTTVPVVTLDTITNGEVFATHAMPGLSGSALDYYSGIASVNVYLNEFSANGILYWNGSSWSSTPAVLSASYQALTVAWEVTNALPSGANLPNGGYQVQVIAANNDFPSGMNVLSVSFSVEDHPVYTFNYGSQYGLTPNYNWSDPANWDAGAVPTSDSVAYINGYSVDNTSLGSVQIYGLTISGGSLTTDGMLITNLNISGGQLSGGIISLPANGIFNWSGGTLSGTYNVPVGATLNLTGSADKTLNVATLSNSGAVYWNGGNILASYGTVINNNATFVMQSSSFFYDNGLLAGNYGYPTFVNNGLMKKTTSNGETIVANNEGGWTFDQNGTLDVENGAFSSQSQFNVNGGAVFAGPGETRVDAGVLTINGTNTIQPGATVELAAGAVNGTGTFGGTGTFKWTGGVIAADLRLQPDTTFNLSGDGPKTLSLATLASAGHGLWTGAGPVICSYGSVFENDGTFTIQNDSSFTNNGVGSGSYGLPEFVNTGVFVKTNSTNTTLFPPDNGGVLFNNQGTVNVQSGYLALGGGGSDASAASTTAAFTVAAGSEIDLTGGAHLFGPGPVNLNGPGLIRLLTAGSVSLGGSVAFTNGGTFEVDAGGTVNGTGTFDGTGTFNWTGGVIAAALSLQTNIALNMTGSADKTLSFATLSNNGPVYWNGGNLVASYGTVINNNATFVMQSSSLFYDNGDGAGSYGLPTFNNNDLMVKTTSNGETIVAPDNGGWTFNQNGTIDVENGALSSQGQFNVNGGAVFAGPGETRVDAGNVLFTGSNTIQQGATVELAGGTWTGNNGGNNVFTGPGTFVWSGGTIAGTTSVDVGANLAIAGDGPKTLNLATLANSGLGLWTGTGPVVCSYGSIFENDGTFTIQNDSSFTNNGIGSGNYGYPAFINNGIFVKTNSTSTTFFLPDNGGVLFNNQGTVSVQSGYLSLGGGGSDASAASTTATFTVAAGSEIDLTGGAHLFGPGVINFNGPGLVRLLTAGSVSLGGNVAFNNSGTFEVDPGGTVNGTGTFGGTGTFNWTGGVIAAALSLQANTTFNMTGSADKTLSLATLNNNGTAYWNGGNIIASYGTVINNNATFVMQSSSFFYDNGVGAGAYGLPAFNNNGLMKKTTSNGETIVANNEGGWTFNQNGTLDVENGAFSSQSQFNVNGGAVFAGPGETRVDAGNILINGTNTIQQGATLELAGGTWTGNNVLSGPGTFVWSGGTISGLSTVGGGANLSIVGDGPKTLSVAQTAYASLTNAGNGLWTGAGPVVCSYGSIFENDGTFTVQNDSSFTNNGVGSGSYGQPAFINNGTFRKTTATGTTSFPSDNGGVSFNNGAIVDLQTGSLAINGGYTLSGVPRLNLVLGGLDPGTQFSQETFVGPATLGGVLSVTLANGFVPTNGQSFAIVTYGSETGQFASQELPKLPSNSIWRMTYGASAVTLKVLPATVVTSPALLANGHFQFLLSGPSAASALILGSTNMVEWIPLLTNAPFDGTLQFDDAEAFLYKGRYYSILIQP
jgi:hypothetical protein